MPDDLLTALDRSFARRPAPGRRAVGGSRSTPPAPVTPAAAARVLRGFAERYPLVEMFVTAQFMWGALLFIPGTQGIRPVVRALPYLSSVLLLFPYFLRKTPGLKHPGFASFLVGALAVLVVNLLHSTTQSSAGIAQCVFQICVAAPAFWAWKAVRDEGRLLRVVRMIFLFSALSAALGILQVYFPEQFMPPQFSTLGQQMNESWVESLTYQGADGRMIVRPPGLTDQPGGAATAGAIAAVLGLGLTLLQQQSRARYLPIAGTLLGLTALYLTQVRSLLLMCLGAFAMMAALSLRRGRVRAAAWLVGSGGVLVLASFVWATAVGGEQVESRYTDIAQKGAVQTFRENRGHFVSYTVGELLDEYPLGAGLGRWGMMYTYFGDPTDLASPPLYAEIQITGWLLDGGVPMWACYGGAITVAVLLAYRLTRQKRSAVVADLATVALGLMVLVIGMSFAGPVFNTQVGILFWFIVASLYGAGAGLLKRSPAPLPA